MIHVPNSLLTMRERSPTPSTSRGWTRTQTLVFPIWVLSKTPPHLKSQWGMWMKAQCSPSIITSWTSTRMPPEAQRWAQWQLETPTAGTVLSGKMLVYPCRQSLGMFTTFVQKQGHGPWEPVKFMVRFSPPSPSDPRWLKPYMFLIYALLKSQSQLRLLCIPDV